MSPKRNAQIVAVTVAVLCPYCGGEQPSPDNGSDAWFPKDVAKEQGRKTCVECDADFMLVPQGHAPVSS